MLIKKVEDYIELNIHYFKDSDIQELRRILTNLDESQLLALESVSLKDPQTALIFSTKGGYFAIDRFYIGDTLLGLLKLLTLGGCLIWFVVDWFFIMERTRQNNLKKVTKFIEQSKNTK